VGRTWQVGSSLQQLQQHSSRQQPGWACQQHGRMGCSCAAVSSTPVPYSPVLHRHTHMRVASASQTTAASSSAAAVARANPQLQGWPF
jgi:endonuclease/exonuclease/phosphatase (EEP) superfamily protein YafD